MTLPITHQTLNTGALFYFTLNPALLKILQTALLNETFTHYFILIQALFLKKKNLQTALLNGRRNFQFEYVALRLYG